MQNKISEVQIVPIKPMNGLVGFASIVFDNSFYLGGIGVYTRPSGGFRLVYPTRKSSNGNSLNVFYPINKDLAKNIESIISEKFQEVMAF